MRRSLRLEYCPTFAVTLRLSIDDELWGVGGVRNDLIRAAMEHGNMAVRVVRGVSSELPGAPADETSQMFRISTEQALVDPISALMFASPKSRRQGRRYKYGIDNNNRTFITEFSESEIQMDDV